MTAEVAAAILPRPPQIGENVTDSLLLQVVREFLYGRDYNACAVMLDLSLQEFYAAIRTTQWNLLQNHFRDEFIATEGMRMVRLQRKCMDKLEEYVESGITVWYEKKDQETGEITPMSYSRELLPKELVSVTLMLNDTNKRLDNIRGDEMNRKKFDGQKMLTDLARFAGAKTIDAEPEREHQTR